jgi:hypothetical protein
MGWLSNNWWSCSRGGGYGGLILNTNNGGVSWNTQLDNAEINEIYFFDAKNGVAVGSKGCLMPNYGYLNYGFIMRTIDGGENWALDSLRNVELNKMYFIDMNNGWIVGGGGLIMKISMDDLSSISKEDYIRVSEYHLSQNYPNPFNPSTTIEFDLPKASDVRIEVYNIAGQKIQTLLNERMPAGSHRVEFDASGFASGIYYYRVEAGGFVEVKKMILVH